MRILPMSLRDVLTDRHAVVLLKILYDNEVLQKSSYTMKLSYAKTRLNLMLAPKDSARALADAGLVAMDILDNDVVLAITSKGKEFIEVFDQLVDLFRPKIVQPRSVSVKYELVGMEKKILALTYRIGKEAGTDKISLKTLVQDLYPYDQSGKAGIVSRYVSRLEEIGLMRRSKEGREAFVEITEVGSKTIREQYLKELMR